MNDYRLTKSLFQLKLIVNRERERELSEENTCFQDSTVLKWPNQSNHCHLRAFPLYSAYIRTNWTHAYSLNYLIRSSIAWQFENFIDSLEALKLLNPAVPYRNFRKNFDLVNVNRIIKEHINFTRLHDPGRLKALQCKESSVWIQTYWHFSRQKFLQNLPVDPICRPHICVCGTFVYEFSAHEVSCQKTAGRFSRHSEINEILLSGFIFHQLWVKIGTLWTWPVISTSTTNQCLCCRDIRLVGPTKH